MPRLAAGALQEESVAAGSSAGESRVLAAMPEVAEKERESAGPRKLRLQMANRWLRKDQPADGISSHPLSVCTHSCLPTRETPARGEMD